MTDSRYSSGHLFAIADNENEVLVGLLRLRADHA
jgi:hypothetical protein